MIGNYTISGLNNGQQYAVEIRAVSSVGAGAWSDVKNVTPTDGTTQPSEVQDFTSADWTITGADAASVLTVTANEVAFTNARRDSHAWVYRDFGEGGLSGKLEFRYECSVTSAENLSQFGFLFANDSVLDGLEAAYLWYSAWRRYDTNTVNGRVGFVEDSQSSTAQFTEFAYRGATNDSTDGTVFATLTVDPVLEIITLYLRYDSHTAEIYATHTQQWPALGQLAFRYLIIGTEGETARAPACTGFVRNLEIL